MYNNFDKLEQLGILWVLNCCCVFYLLRKEHLMSSLQFFVWVLLSRKLVNRYEGQRDMLCNGSFKLDQVAFAMEGIKDKDAQQTVCATTIHTFLKFAIYHLPHVKWHYEDDVSGVLIIIIFSVVFVPLEILIGKLWS